MKRERLAHETHGKAVSKVSFFGSTLLEGALILIHPGFQAL